MKRDSASADAIIIIIITIIIISFKKILPEPSLDSPNKELLTEFDVLFF